MSIFTLYTEEYQINTYKVYGDFTPGASVRTGSNPKERTLHPLTVLQRIFIGIYQLFFYLYTPGSPFYVSRGVPSTTA